MTDSVAVFPPGYRLTDSSTGAPIVGATIAFYDAGTSSPKTVYSDADLSVSLGTSVTTDALGCPTSNGTTKADVYVGTADYKVVILDADDVVIETKDNRPGAVVSATVDPTVTASFPVITKSLDYVVLPADQNATFVVNCSSADVTLTLPSAVTVETGWNISVQHAGSANQVLLATVSSQTISEGSKNFSTQYALALNGEDVQLTSDGGNWRISSHTAPFVKVGQGVLAITDRLSAPPGGPVQGSLYLLTTAPSGVWSGFLEHDIVQYAGGTTAWVNFTPATDCGWIAYVADEDLYYHFVGTSWRSEYASSTYPGVVTLATQTTMEALENKTVAADFQHFHPGHPKVWGKATVSGNVPTLQASYNMTSITDTATGRLTGTIASDFSSANWAATVNIESSSFVTSGMVATGTQAAGTFEARCYNSGGILDPDAWHWSGLGDL